jgi:hypothetical protein
MKRSTQLLLGVLALVLLALVGTAFALRAEYRRTDFNDPLRRYRPVPVAALRHLHLDQRGYPFGEIRVRPGTEPVLYVWKEEPTDSVLTHHRADTLVLSSARQRLDPYRQQPLRDHDLHYLRPHWILVVPGLQSLTMGTQSVAVLDGLRGDSLRVRAAGGAALQFRSCELAGLRLALRDSAFAEADARCRVGMLVLDAAGTSGLKLSTESVRAFRPRIADARVEVRLRGTRPAEVLR